MKAAVVSGCETKTRCEAPRTTCTRAPDRWAMNCWAAGGMILSAPLIRLYVGIVCQACGPGAGSPNAAPAAGRWATA